MDGTMLEGVEGLVQALVDLRESMCKGKGNTKPKRTPGGPKKFAVCADGKLVRFGDPNLEIKRDSAKRRKNFRARHNCANPGPRTKAKYWACKTWEKGRTVSDVVEHRAPLRMIEGLDRSVPELAFKAREKARDDEKAGHEEGAEYWRGWAAGSFLTGNKGLQRSSLNLIR